MNIKKNYDVENFDSYDNFYTILEKKIPIYKKVKDDKNNVIVELSEEKTKYIPIYGHFYNDENYFIYVKVRNKKLLNRYRDYAYHKTSIDNLARPIHSTYYRIKDVNNLYLILEQLQKQ